MRKVIVLSFLVVVGCTAAIPVRNEDWIQLGKPGPNHELSLTFAIQRTNPSWLAEKLRAVSYPDSPDYGKYMNFDEIAEYVHGRPESVRAVVDALASVGVGMERIDFTLGRDFGVVAIPVAAAETLFAAEFYEFQHSKEPDWKIVRCLSHTVPKSLTEHLEFVFGLTEFPAPTKVEKVTGCETATAMTNPILIDSVYNLTSYQSTNSSNSQAVGGLGTVGVNFSPDDLTYFQREYSISLNPITKIVGTNNASDPGIEVSLDVEYITAVGRNVATWYVARPDADFLKWVVEMVNTTDSPWVHSVSFAADWPAEYQIRCDDEFMKFGISGRTLLFPSGDLGVHCVNKTFVPIWPGSSPHITSVGGTLINNEEAWTCGGGGFSDVFPTPAYQLPVVKAYLESGTAPPTTYFHSNGRAYPDVSAFSVAYDGIVNDKSGAFYGTSFATPTVAGVVSCLNDIRLNKGKPTLGFLNPLLYQTFMGKGFNDITKGENIGISTCPGFKAIKGWDPASGWGSPNFGILSNLV